MYVYNNQMCKIYTILFKSDLHLSVNNCINLQVCYSNCVNLHRHYSFLFKFLFFLYVFRDEKKILDNGYCV